MQRWRTPRAISSKVFSSNRRLTLIFIATNGTSPNWSILNAAPNLSNSLVIALTGLEDLPESFVEWLHEWFESRGQLETACVFCISNRSSQASLPRCQQLPSLAHAHGLAFFSTTIALPDNAAPTGINPKTWLS